MSDGAASSSEPQFDLPQDGRWRREFWVSLVGSVDALLRAYHGIAEFTADPACVLRIGIVSAREAVTLSDGSEIQSGEPVGSLHLWNEHLPPYRNGGPDLAWASDMRRRVRYSLQLLADHVAHEPAWQAVRAFRGDATLSPRLGDTQIRRLAERHGFERIDAASSILGQLHYIGDCFNTWALTRAFNPVALERQGFLRGRYEMWISRRALLDRYGREGQRHGSSLAAERAV
jgi:hypothetical protein